MNRDGGVVGVGTVVTSPALGMVRVVRMVAVVTSPSPRRMIVVGAVIVSSSLVPCRDFPSPGTVMLTSPVPGIIRVVGTVTVVM